MDTRIVTLPKGTWVAVSTTEGLLSNQERAEIRIATGANPPAFIKGHPLQYKESINFKLEAGDTVYAYCWKDSEIIVTDKDAP